MNFSQIYTSKKIRQRHQQYKQWKSSQIAEKNGLTKPGNNGSIMLVKGN